MKLLSESKKTELTEGYDPDYMYAMLYLEPSEDYRKICPASTKGCRSSCLTNSGMMKMPTQSNARAERTRFYLENPNRFKALLVGEIHALIRKATRKGKKVSIRLNGTSDIDWSDIYQQFPEVQFNEYTKMYARMSKMVEANPNLHLTASRQEKMNSDTLFNTVHNGFNTAVVFDVKPKEELPISFYGIPVIDGDLHDKRWAEERGHIIGLRLKGTNQAKEHARETGFAVKVGE